MAILIIDINTSHGLCNISNWQTMGKCSLKYVQHISGLTELQPLYLALQYILFYICMQKDVKL